MILTSAEGDVYLKTDSTNLGVIFPDSMVVFSKMMNKLKSRCQINVKWFPYDEQKCTFILASTIYTNDLINYLDSGNNTIAPYKFTENDIWDLVDYGYEIVNVEYPGYYGAFAELHIHLHIRRKPLFITINLVIPALFLSVVTLISFYTPFAQSMPVSMSVILAYSVLAIR